MVENFFFLEFRRFSDKILSMNGKHKAQIYHVYLGDRRTTVSLDDTTAFFMALKLKQEPRTPEAKQATKEWLQAQLDEQCDTGRALVSSWLRFQVMLWLVDKRLSKEYDEWLDQQL